MNLERTVPEFDPVLCESGKSSSLPQQKFKQVRRETSASLDISQPKLLEGQSKTKNNPLLQHSEDHNKTLNLKKTFSFAHCIGLRPSP